MHIKQGKGEQNLRLGKEYYTPATIVIMCNQVKVYSSNKCLPLDIVGPIIR